MPTQRFLNLPQEKQDKILAAAREELSRVPLDEISINQIVRAAGIPRGSFYQYFDNKMDLLNYILGDFGGALHRRVKAILENSHGDILQIFNDMLRGVIALGTTGDNYLVARNIFADLRVNEATTCDAMRFDTERLLNEYERYIDFSHLRCQTPQEKVALVDMLLSLFRRAIVMTFSDISQKDAAQQQFETQLGMIRHGILQEEKKPNGKI